MNNQPLNPFEANVSQIVIQSETNPGRFEVFCRDMVSFAEGDAVVMPTSTSWDLGRDGVGIGRSGGIYLAASLRDDVDAKALSDIERLLSTTGKVARLYFCSNQALSEHRKDQIQQALEREVEFAFPIVCLGSIQLADLGRQQRRSLERNYGAEIRDCLRAIARDPLDESEVSGLRLALISSGEDSHEIRESIYSGGLLDVLADGRSRTIEVCSRELSGNLRLSRNLAPASIQPHLRQLADNGQITFDGRSATITTPGLERVERQSIEAATKLMQGRVAIQKALENSIGSKLSTDDFARIWSIFEERMTHYFQSRGEAIVGEVSAILNGEGSQADTSFNSLSFLDEFATSIANTSHSPQRREELQLAVKDLFADRTGEAAQWLVRVCASYVAACALGLEHKSGLAISKLFARTSIVLDTDVVLSLLGEGEPEHAAAQTIVRRWTENGGKVLVGDPVLDEVAYHAHIAQQDFNQVSHFLPGTAADRLHVIENAFVRSFAELMSRKEATQSQWRKYIGQFRGADERDSSRAFSTLAAEYSIRRLPARSTAQAELANQVRLFLLDAAERASPTRVDKKTRDKAARDAELYAALVNHVDTVKESDPGATCILVSSARRLVNVETQFHRAGEDHMVISISAALYIVSLMPNVALGLSAMKAFLFDERRGRFSSDLERTLIRMVKASQEVSMPFAKRGILMREVRDRLLKDADVRRGKRGDLHAIEERALNDVNKDRTIEILRDSLDAIAVDSRLERENKSLRERVDELERKLSRKK